MPSQALLHSRHFVLNLRAAFLIVVWCLTAAASVQAQTPSQPAATPNISREDHQLNEARRQNEEAQAEYYRTQTRKLNEPAPTKSFWRTLSDNAAILGALTAALVALFTLIVNQRTALRARKDTEFYEALKRFGDQDSPTLRASAAGLLNEMAKIRVFALRWRRTQPWWRPDRKMLRYPYFDTALEQLITALRLEEDRVVLGSIVNNLQRLIPNDISRSAELLRLANLELQRELVSWLAALVGCRTFASGKLRNNANDPWNEAASLTTFPLNSLEACGKRFYDYFEKEKQNTATVFDELSSEQQREHLSKIQLELERNGSRLRQNIEVCVKMFELCPERFGKVPFTYVFLADAEFPSESNLQNIDLRWAILHKANLFNTKLRGTQFEGAYLHDAVLMDADLAEAKLAGAQINRSTNLRFTNWWKADFALPDVPVERLLTDTAWGEFIDVDLLEKIIKHVDVRLRPEIVQDAHLSVRRYLQERARAERTTMDQPLKPDAEAEGS